MSDNNINVVFSVSREYIPMCAVALRSLAENSNSSHVYNLHILHTELSSEDQLTLNDEFKNFSHIKLFFINVGNFIQSEDFENFYESGYVTTETYFRLYLPFIFNKLDKIIYSDIDVIYNTDIALLYEFDVSNYLLSATRNISAIYNYNNNSNLSNGLTYKKYFDDVLNLSNIEEYIQAGICVYNLKKMREFGFTQKCLELLKKIKEPVFYDQCIVSSVCQGNINFLPLCWNHVWYFSRYEFLKDFVPQDLYQEYDFARKYWNVCHYAGPKPFREPCRPLAQYFWEIAVRTKFFEYFIQQLQEETLKKYIKFNKNIKKYYKYKYLSKLTFGKLRQKYLDKYLQLKELKYTKKFEELEKI